MNRPGFHHRLGENGIAVAPADEVPEPAGGVEETVRPAVKSARGVFPEPAPALAWRDASTVGGTETVALRDTANFRRQGGWLRAAFSTGG